jgi:arylsulfatase A-like enzyme
MRREDTGFLAMSKRSGKVDDRYTVDRTIGWIKTHRGSPFFIYVNLQNSHFPFVVGPDFKRPFGKENLDFQPKFNRLEPEMIAPMRARYRDSLAYIDQQLGRLFDYLKQEGMEDKTIVAVTGDNGQAFMEHGFSAHANRLYNEALRTPLILRIPGRPPTVTDRQVQHIDLTPTILGSIGLPKHPSFQGVDLFTEPESHGREVFFVVQTPLAEQYAIIKDGFKYIHEPFSDGSFLYDLRRDPGEKENIALEKKELALNLRRRLDTWRKLQIDYYRNEKLHMTTYPPVMKDTPLPGGASIEKKND